MVEVTVGRRSGSGWFREPEFSDELLAVPVGITDLVATVCRHGLEPEGYSARDIARAPESDERPRLTTIFDAR